MSPVVPPISVMTTSYCWSDTVLDLVRHVRDDLHGAAQVVAFTFLLQNALIDLAARQVVVPRKDAVSEALVMAKIEIRLRTVVQDINFTMLERIHRSRIDIEIGIEFLEDNAQTTQLKQRAERSRGQALAQ